jgi:hypothetical protein
LRHPVAAIAVKDVQVDHEAPKGAGSGGYFVHSVEDIDGYTVSPSQAVFDDLLSYHPDELFVAETVSYDMRLGQPPAAIPYISFVCYVRRNVTSIESLNVCVEPICICIIEIERAQEIRHDPLCTTRRTSATGIKPPFHARLVQVISATLAVGKGLDHGIEVFVADDALPLDVFACRLEPVLEKFGSHAQHIFVS